MHEYSKEHKRILISLDSNHTHEHVLAELEAYAPLTSKDSYCVVFDTVIGDKPKNLLPDRPWGRGIIPKQQFGNILKNHLEFEIDKTIQHKLLITVAPEGHVNNLIKMLNKQPAAIHAYGDSQHIDINDNWINRYHYFYSDKLKIDSPTKRLLAIIRYLSDCLLIHGIFKTDTLRDAFSE